MTTMLMSALVKTLPLPCIQDARVAYFRSKLFVVPLANNPLLAAAGPLLSLVERLCLSSSLPPVDYIRENIEHEIRAFHSRLQGHHYAEELTAIAHYLLGATIDEMLGKNYLRIDGRVATFQAFTPLSSDNIGPEQRFFDILLHVKERPNQYLDLIELAYYCLIAGFEGKEHMNPNGRSILDNLIEELFQLIQQHRVNKSHHLFKEIRQVTPIPESPKTLLTVAILSLSLLVAGFFVSGILLENKVKIVQLNHPVIAALDE